MWRPEIVALSGESEKKEIVGYSPDENESDRIQKLR